MPPDEIRVEPLLLECDMGVWQGMTTDEIEARYPGAFEERKRNRWTYPIPNGETYSEASDRAVRWLSLPAQTPVKIVVTHEMLSRTIQGAYRQLAPDETLALSHPHGTIVKLQAGIAELTS